MNRRLIIYIIIFLITVIIYLKQGSGAAVVIMSIMAAYALAAFVFVKKAGMDISVTFGQGSMVEKGETLEIGSVIRNNGRLPVPLIEAEVAAKNSLSGEGTGIPIRGSISPGGMIKGSVAFSDDNCGKISFSIDSACVKDPLELFSAGRECRGETAGYVAPTISAASIDGSYLDSYNMESYRYSQYEKGSDPGEVFGIREYAAGDSLKHIHWKLSAKMDEMMVKIPSFPIENNIIIILDNLLAPGTDPAPEERSGLVEFMYSMSAALIKKDVTHTIGWFDIERGVFRTAEVRDPEQIRMTIPDVTGCGYEESEVSAVYRYLESLEGQGFTNHFLVTLQDERDTELLESYGEVRVFRGTE